MNTDRPSRNCRPGLRPATRLGLLGLIGLVGLPAAIFLPIALGFGSVLAVPETPDASLAQEQSSERPPVIEELEALSGEGEEDPLAEGARFLMARCGGGPCCGCGAGLRMHPGHERHHRGALRRDAGRPPIDRGPGWMAARRLGLSGEQRAVLRPVRREYAEAMRDLRRSFEAGEVSASEAGDRAVQLRASAESQARSILSAEQWSEMQDLREQRKERMIERRSDRFARRADRQAAHYIRRLRLSKEQASSVRRVFEETIPERRRIADGVAGGAIAPEQGSFSMRQIDKDAEAEVRALLTPDQAKRLDALKELRRPGPGARRHPDRSPGWRRPFEHRGPRF